MLRARGAFHRDGDGVVGDEESGDHDHSAEVARAPSSTSAHGAEVTIRWGWCRRSRLAGSQRAAEKDDAATESVAHGNPGRFAAASHALRRRCEPCTSRAKQVWAIACTWIPSLALVALAATLAVVSLDLHDREHRAFFPLMAGPRLTSWLDEVAAVVRNSYIAPVRSLQPALHPDRLSVVLFTRRHPHHLHTLLSDLEAHPSVGEVLVWDASDGSARVDRLSSARVRVFAGTWGSWASVGEAWSAEAHPPLLFALAGVSSFPRVLLLDDRWGRVPGSVLESLEGRSRGSVRSVHGLFGWSLCAEGSSSSSSSSSSSPPSPSSPWSSYPSLVVSSLSSSSSSSSSVSLVSLYGLLFRREYAGAVLEVRPLVSSWFRDPREAAGRTIPADLRARIRATSIAHTVRNGTQDAPILVRAEAPVFPAVHTTGRDGNGDRHPPTASPHPYPTSPSVPRPVEDWFDHPVDRALFAWTARRLGGVGALVVHTDLGDAWTRAAKGADGAPGPTWSSGSIPGWWGWVVLWELGLGVFGCEVREDEASWRARASTRALWPTTLRSMSSRSSKPFLWSKFSLGVEADESEAAASPNVTYREHRLPLFDRRAFLEAPMDPDASWTAPVVESERPPFWTRSNPSARGRRPRTRVRKPTHDGGSTPAPPTAPSSTDAADRVRAAPGSEQSLSGTWATGRLSASERWKALMAKREKGTRPPPTAVQTDGSGAVPSTDQSGPAAPARSNAPPIGEQSALHEEAGRDEGAARAGAGGAPGPPTTQLAVDTDAASFRGSNHDSGEDFDDDDEEQGGEDSGGMGGDDDERGPGSESEPVLASGTE